MEVVFRYFINRTVIYFDLASFIFSDRNTNTILKKVYFNIKLSTI